MLHLAGHDINYLAVSDALHPLIGDRVPRPPLNMLGDFGVAENEYLVERAGHLLDRHGNSVAADEVSPAGS